MINHQLKNHSYSLDYLDNQMPWERTIIIAMVEQDIKEENERIQKQLGTSGVKREYV